MEIAGHLANVVDWPTLAEPDWMENDLLRMKLQAFAVDYPELAGNVELWVPPDGDLDGLVPYR